MSNYPQKHIGKYFPNRAILYQPGLSLVFKSTNVGILLSQLLYWHEKGSKKGGWIYKTMDEMKMETGLTRTNQETAIRICRQYQLFDYKLSGIPATRHFKLNMTQLENLLPSMKKVASIVYPNPLSKYAENPQTITEITQETTTINTNKSLIKNNIDQVGLIIKQKYRYEKDVNSNDFGKK